MQFQGLEDIRKQWSEKEFQTQVLRVAQPLGWALVYHTHDSRRSNPGFPDLMLIHEEKRLLVIWELKTEKGAVSKEQWAWINGFRLTLGLAPNVQIGVRRPRDWDLMVQALSGDLSAGT